MANKIVDFHAHAFHDKIAKKAAQNLEDYYGIPLAGDGSFQALLDDVEKHGVDTIVVHATATKFQQVPVINDYVASLLSRDILGFGTLHPDYPGISEEFERIVSLGLKGLKLHPVFQGFNIDDASMYPIYEKAEGRLPILMHMGDRNSDCCTPQRLDRVLTDFPNLTVIAAHMGGFSEWESSLEFLIGRDNVYMDTSSSVRFMEPLAALSMIRAHGADKILFGTDYPLSLYRAECAVLDNLGLTAEESEMIFWKNAYKLLQIEK